MGRLTKGRRSQKGAKVLRPRKKPSNRFGNPTGKSKAEKAENSDETKRLSVRVPAQDCRELKTATPTDEPNTHDERRLQQLLFGILPRGPNGLRHRHRAHMVLRRGNKKTFPEDSRGRAKKQTRWQSPGVCDRGGHEHQGKRAMAGRVESSSDQTKGGGGD